MASVAVLNAPWKKDYPEFYDMLMKSMGELQYVDEYGVPFWGGMSSVFVKQHWHPLFSREVQSMLLENARLMCKDGGHLQIIQETLDLFNREMEFWLQTSEPEFSKSPITLPKDLYNRFKISCHAVFLNGRMPA